MTSVIIADDHPFLREGVRAVLTQAGLEVSAAVGDGDDALAAIEQHDPDVAILDVRMPGCDGIEALQTMRKRGDQRPVILLTAVIEDRQLLEAMRAGVSGIVFKQGGENQLIEALDIVSKGGNAIPLELIGRALDHSQKPSLPSPMAPSASHPPPSKSRHYQHLEGYSWSEPFAPRSRKVPPCRASAGSIG